jgi:hypothetical protein
MILLEACSIRDCIHCGKVEHWCWFPACGVLVFQREDCTRHGSLTPEGIARDRNDLHYYGGNQSPRLFKDRLEEERIGVLGEVDFGCLHGLPIDLDRKLYGDSGVDFEVGALRIDVKASRKPYNLLVKVTNIHGRANVYVQGKYIRKEDSVEFLGWSTKGVMLKQPTKVFHKGVDPSHYLPARRLQPMKELTRLINAEQLHGWLGGKERRNHETQVKNRLDSVHLLDGPAAGPGSKSSNRQRSLPT